MWARKARPLVDKETTLDVIVRDWMQEYRR